MNECRGTALSRDTYLSSDHRFIGVNLVGELNCTRPSGVIRWCCVQSIVLSSFIDSHFMHRLKDGCCLLISLNHHVPSWAFVSSWKWIVPIEVCASIVLESELRHGNAVIAQLVLVDKKLVSKFCILPPKPQAPHIWSAQTFWEVCLAHCARRIAASRALSSSPSLRYRAPAQAHHSPGEDS